MNAEQRELFRLALLRVLDANHTRYGLGVAALCHLAGLFGFRAAPTDDVADDMEYLKGKGVVEEVFKRVSRENRAWRITQQGVAYLDERS